LHVELNVLFQYIQVAVERLLRAAFMLALFAALFGSAHWTMHATKKCHITVLRLLGCQVRHASVVVYQW